MVERAGHGQCVYRSDHFHAKAVYGFLEWEKRDRFHAMLTERKFPLSSTDASSRVINSWEMGGVVDDPRSDGQGWRRFNLLEVTWLHAAIRLRRFGLSIQALTRARNTMNDAWGGYQIESSSRITLFEIYLVQAMRSVPVFLIVFEDGTADLATDSQYDATSTYFRLADHVRIELNRTFQSAYPESNWAIPKFESRFPVSHDELSTIEAIKNGNFSSITLTLDNGKVKTIRATEEIAGERIIDLLKENDFQDIEIKQRDGNVVHLTRTIITKL